MVNQIVLVGRIARTPEARTTESGKKIATLTLAVPRNFKNINGEYDTDFFDCTLWSSIAESTSEYCKTGDMVGIKGRLQSRIIESPEGNKRRKTEIIAEKVTFLTSNTPRKNDSAKEEKEEADE
jgi:single-strand DNA-binding protein